MRPCFCRYVDRVEWCISSTTPSVTGANFTAWALSACDYTPLKHGPAPDLTAAGVTTTLTFGAPTEVGPGSDIYIGARTRNSLGLYSSWMWSPVTKIGATAAAVDPEAESSTVLMDVVIPAYGVDEGESTETAAGSKIQLVDVSNKTSGVRYEKMSRRRLRELNQVHNASAAGRAAQRRALQSGSSTVHESITAFTLDLAGSDDETFEYSLTYNTSEQLLPNDPALADFVLLARLQPTLMALSASSEWVEAATTCNPVVPFFLNPGLYRVAVCKSTSVNQFKLTFQASPTAAVAWAQAGCNGTIGCNTSSPEFIEKYIEFGVDQIDFERPTVLVRYQPAPITPDTELIIDGSGSTDYDGGHIASYRWRQGHSDAR